MPASVIQCIEVIANKEQQNKTLVFTDINSNPIEDNDVSAGVDNNEDDYDDDDGGNANNPLGILLDEPEENKSNESEHEDNTDYLNDESSGVPITLHDEKITGVHDEGDHHTTNDETETTPQAEISRVVTETTGLAETTGLVAETTGVIANEEQNNEEEPNVEQDDEEEPDVEPYNPDTWTPSVQRVHVLRPRKGREYIHLHAMVMHHAMTQYSLKKGIKKFKKVGEAAVSKELMQLHMRETFTPQNVKELSSEQKRGALDSLMFLKEKRNGTIKGRACADRRKQREKSDAGAVTSPTVTLESVLITSTIKAFEKREFAVVDIPGAYLSADIDEEVIMLLRGRLAELMVKTAPNIYRKYITVDSNNQPVLHVKLQKALYGCLQSALMLYLKFVGDIESQGFELNPCDPCVANKMMRCE
jgi:hypothetical protein